MPAWIPALFGILTPMCFTASGVLSKHLTSPETKFNPSTLAFTSYLIVNTIVIIVAIIYWIKTESFSPYLFWIGIFGSGLNTVGLTFI